MTDQPLMKSPMPQDLDKHRAAIGLRLEVLVRKTDKFGWDKMDAGVRTILRKDWMDALVDYRLDEIDSACREYIKANPDKCPNEGHIVKLILMQRRIESARNRTYEPPPVFNRGPIENRRAEARQIMASIYSDSPLKGEA